MVCMLIEPLPIGERGSTEMKLLKTSMLVLFASVLVSPVISATPAHAWKKKCWHCYKISHGKKVCHDDCRCYGKHW